MPLKWIHLPFACGVTTYVNVPDIWSEVAAPQTKKEGLTVLTQYLLTGMELCCREFHGHVELLHVGGGVYNFLAGNRFSTRGTNPACPVREFSV